MSNVLKSLNESLHQMMRDDARVVVLGEDILDPYGGAFKVTRGLSTAFPERVLTTPIAEAGFVGVAAGMALRGLRPVVEIMFGDFLMLAADQVLNHIAKYRWMYNEQVRVPLVIRAPMGGGRGYGPTHSQSVEKHFIGVPGLRVVAPSPLHDPGALLRRAVLDEDDPVLFVENKLMYARKLLTATHGGRVGHTEARVHGAAWPTVSLSFDGFDEADVTLVTYGGMAEVALQAAEQLLIDEEIVTEVVVASSLNPLDLEPIAQSLSRSGRLVVVEEGAKTAGWGAEVMRRVATEHFALLRTAPVHVAALDVPIANTRTLEALILPGIDNIVSGLRNVARSDARASRPAPVVQAAGA